MAERKQGDPRFYLLRDAAFADRKEAQRLIDADPAIVHARDSIGETALHYLAVENEVDAVAWLLARGAEIDNRNDFAGTPLIDAANVGWMEMCRFLLDNGADLLAKDHNGMSAISAHCMGSAAEQKNTALLAFLLSHLDGVDINDLIDDIDAVMISKHAPANVLALLQAHGFREARE